jgi:hypothetical protein
LKLDPVRSDDFGKAEGGTAKRALWLWIVQKTLSRVVGSRRFGGYELLSVVGLHVADPELLVLHDPCPNPF